MSMLINRYSTKVCVDEIIYENNNNSLGVTELIIDI